MRLRFLKKRTKYTFVVDENRLSPSLTIFAFFPPTSRLSEKGGGKKDSGLSTAIFSKLKQNEGEFFGYPNLKTGHRSCAASVKQPYAKASAVFSGLA